jgi:sarcosine oxidase, subunit alpha
MTGLYRTKAGGRLDRSQRLAFTFDGRPMTGLQGDTLASALIANGVHLVARSFKYHRPRGILSAGTEEPNALMTIDRGGGRTTPNVRATEVELYEGLTALSQNRWPSLQWDAGAIADRLSPLLSAGFYYKTFLQPARFWTHVYEPIIRRAAGMGRAPVLPDPDTYLNRHAHCDVLICGAGPAGLAAALAASEAGARVILADEQSEMGGSLLSEATATINGKSSALWLSETLDILRGRQCIRLLSRTTAFGVFPDRMIGLVERNTDHLAHIPVGRPRETLWQVRAKQVIVATGAIERPLIFAGNDRPGIMLADAARTYLVRHGAAVGARVVVATACDSAYRAAIELNAAGIDVPLIADLRPQLTAAAEEARSTGIEVMTNMHVAWTHGRRRVSAVEIEERGGGTFRRRIECDALLMSGGWTPSVHLVSQARIPLDFDADRQIFVPAATKDGVVAAGGCNGTFDLAAGLREGYAAGVATARAAGRLVESKVPTFDVAAAASLAGGAPGVGHEDQDYRHDKAFVDFQNDVTVEDLAQATREGFRSIEHVKRYTTNGMATDQGKTSNLNALAIVGSLVGKSIPEIGQTTFRMPVTPVTFGALAGMARGAQFDPERTTPLHDIAVNRGAVFEDVGQWKRAHTFPTTFGDGSRETMAAAVARECRITRAAVGLFDASTLGKIEIGGPDAPEFVARIYANHWPRLGPGQCRYGLMLKDDGTIFDDGIVAMLAPDRFHVTTTTGGAARVLHHMEDYRQTEWPDLHVWLTSVTEQWAVIAVQGPQARETLRPLVDDIDLSRLAMPHMTVREGLIRGVPTRLFRVSFTGELGFEVNVPAGAACAVWEAIAAQVAANSGAWYGTEAMHVMRAEKGYILVGQETDGTVTADDVGLGAMFGKSKPDFVGKRGALRSGLISSGRKQLVGLLTADPMTVLQEGAQITAEPNPHSNPGSNSGAPAHALGHVTSAYWSATLGRSIALGLLEDGRNQHGTGVHVSAIPPVGMTATSHAVTVVDPVFYDPQGGRLRV